MLVAIVVIFLVSFIASSLIGHWVHLLLHQPFMRWFYRAHLQHHVLYPHGDVTSERYRKASWFNSGPFLFTPPFLFIIIVFGGLALLANISPWFVADVAAGLIAFGLVNDLIHDSFHLDSCWLQRYAWYERLRGLHFVHHKNPKRNLGIATLVWDRTLGTFSNR